MALASVRGQRSILRHCRPRCGRSSAGSCSIICGSARSAPGCRGATGRARYVGLVGKAGRLARAVLGRDRSIRSTRPSSTSPSARASMPTTPMWAQCCIPASRPGRPRSPPPSTPALPAPEVLAAVVAGYETTIRIGLAVQPSHFKRGFQSTGTCDVFRHRGRRRAALVPWQGCRATHRRGHRACRRLRRGCRAVLLFRRVGASASRLRIRPRAALRPRCSLSRAMAVRPISSKAPAALPAPMPTAWNPAAIEDGLGRRFHLMDVLVKSHAAAARIAAGIDGMLALRQEHGFSGDDIASMALGIPRIIQGRLTNPHPVDLQAAQMCLPFGVALASKIALSPGTRPDRQRRGLRGRAFRSQPAHNRGAHYDCTGRRGRGREQRAFNRSARQRDAARWTQAFQARAGAKGQPVTAVHRGGARSALHPGAFEPRADKSLFRNRRNVAKSRSARSAPARARSERGVRLKSSWS